MNCTVIFGGTGFIGSFFARFLLDRGYTGKVYLVDIEPLEIKRSEFRKKYIANDPRIVFILADVRLSIPSFDLEGKVELIANFSAVHREPGHADFEYFDTNLKGAENICKFAEKVDCNSIIFTSSISPYGIGELQKDESTIPVPVTAYGSSKLVSEKIHQIWQAKNLANRNLVIVRPGVVFGPGEDGNVSRLIKAVIHRYFFFMGNQATRKSGVYVAELCNAMWWVLHRQQKCGEAVSLFNMSMNPSPSIGEYVHTICKVKGIKRFFPVAPFKFLLATSYIIDFLAKPFSLRHPFSPVRIRKLVRSNNVLPGYLIEHGYKYEYSLYDAFCEWKKLCPEEWR